MITYSMTEEEISELILLSCLKVILTFSVLKTPPDKAESVIREEIQSMLTMLTDRKRKESLKQSSHRL